MGWEKVQCLVEDVDEKAAAHMSFIKNAERKSLSPIDIAQHVQYMMERYGYNVEDLVRLGYAVHRSTLDNYLHLLELPEDIQDKVSNGDIPATAGYHIYRLKDEELQRKLADELSTGETASTRKVKRKVEALIASRNKEPVRTISPVIEGEIPGVYFKDASDMSELADESVHLVLTSPPYCIGLEYEADVSLDEHFQMMDQSLSECARVLCPGGIIFLNFDDIHNHGTRSCGAPEILPVGASYQDVLRTHDIRLTDTIIWEKAPNWINNPQVSYSERTRHTSYRTLNNTEHLWVFRKAGQRNVPIDLEYHSKISKADWKEWVNGVWRINAVGKQKDHPAQFPEELAGRAVRMFSYVGDVVLDPFLGSGTTIKVARELNRVGVGYEKDARYKEIIMRKLGLAISREAA